MPEISRPALTGFGQRASALQRGETQGAVKRGNHEYATDYAAAGHRGGAERFTSRLRLLFHAHGSK